MLDALVGCGMSQKGSRRASGTLGAMRHLTIVAGMYRGPGDGNRMWAALVTGAARWIGRAIVERLVEEGYAVAISESSVPALNEFRGSIGAAIRSNTLLNRLATGCCRPILKQLPRTTLRTRPPEL
jgi:hypothetical protein